jgi:hypothetical protein
MSDSDQQSAADRLDLAVKLLSLLYAVISLVWLLWMLTPEHQRRAWAMAAAAATERKARAVSRSTGRQAITLEARSGCENYGLPYALGLLAERAHRAYDRLRYT